MPSGVFVRKPRIPTCHPDRKHYGRGYCEPCYKLHKPPTTTVADCHPDRRHVAHGLCSACYQDSRPKKRIRRPWTLGRNSSKIKSKYGITIEEYISRKNAQDNKCGICGTEMKVAHLDHNHTTGQLRMFLCRACNQGMGCFKEEPVLFLKAIEYLAKFRNAGQSSASTPTGLPLIPSP